MYNFAYMRHYTDYRLKRGDANNIIRETGSVIYVQKENWETSITIFSNVLTVLMKKTFILIL
jgi:hypothetical protein